MPEPVLRLRGHLALQTLPVMRGGRFVFLLLSLTAWAGAKVVEPRPSAAKLWQEHVQALLDKHCVKCHGPIEQKSGLELDTVEAVLRGGDDGPAVVPGEPEKSPLYTYLAPDSDPHMPPKKQLDDTERAAIRDWIVALAQPEAPSPVAEAEPLPTDPVAAVDYWVARGWKERGVTPAPPADERTWLRRVYLDLAGRVPTAAEVEAFLFSPSPHKREELVDALLAEPAYARRLREMWDVWLMQRAEGGRATRRKENGWWGFLEKAFAQDRPWNEMVRAIITARPATEDDKGAQWFIYERRNNHQQIAEALAPVIYGATIDCAQCHDHALAREIKQAHYWGLVAAFNRSKNAEGTPSRVEESAVGGYINFTNLRKESQPALITLLTGRTVEEARPAEGEKEEDSPDRYIEGPDGTKVPKFSRRAALAEAATTDNPLLARAFVNRMWAALLGRGLVHPPDEMTSRNQPSHPELLDWLAQDFAAHGYRPRHLVRTLVLSRVYALAPWTGETPPPPPQAFAAALERPLTAEQLARSFQTVAGVPVEEGKLLREFTSAVPDVLPRDYNASLRQAQFLDNSPEIAELLQPTAPTVAHLLSLPNPAARVRSAFLAVFGRLPDEEEAAHALAFLSDPSRPPEAALRELLWAMLTSPEFLLMP